MMAVAENYLKVDDFFVEYSEKLDTLRFLLINKKHDLCLDYTLYPEPDESGCDVYHWKKSELLVLDRDNYESFLENVKNAFEMARKLQNEKSNF